MVQLFAQSKRFSGALSLISGAPIAKLPLLLSHILKKLGHTKTKLFSQAEEERLCALLEVSASNLTTLLDACAFIFEQAAYYQINGDILASQLTEAGLGAEQAEVFKLAWQELAVAYVARLRTATIAPDTLHSVHWRLHLSVGSSAQGQTKNESAVVQFNLSKEGEDTIADSFTTEFTQSELVQFYDKLEAIQAQLDALKS